MLYRKVKTNHTVTVGARQLHQDKCLQFNNQPTASPK